MKLTNKYEISCWAYYQCYNGNDTPEMRALITNSGWAFCYCRHIKDREEVREYIKDKYYLRTLRLKRKFDEINRQK